jgi:hypothetical protein
MSVTERREHGGSRSRLLSETAAVAFRFLGFPAASGFIRIVQQRHITASRAGALTAAPQARPPPACANTDLEGCSSWWTAVEDEDERRPGPLPIACLRKGHDLIVSVDAAVSPMICPNCHRPLPPPIRRLPVQSASPATFACKTELVTHGTRPANHVIAPPRAQAGHRQRFDTAHRIASCRNSFRDRDPIPARRKGDIP